MQDKLNVCNQLLDDSEDEDDDPEIGNLSIFIHNYYKIIVEIYLTSIKI